MGPQWFCTFEMRSATRLLLFRLLYFLWMFPLITVQWETTVPRSLPLTSGACTINPDWHGSWFHIESNQPLQIGGQAMDMKGECIDQRKTTNQYIFRLQTKSVECWKCIIFFPQHKNVLMYKETRCSRHPSPTVETLCSEFDGDTPRITLFRVAALPEPCPITGPLEFTYRDMRGECASHMSTVSQCASQSTLRFMYQSCPEVSRSESKTEDLECIGHWSNGWNKMFAVRILNRPAIIDGQNYRCIIYDEKLGKLGISAEASCRELINIDSASVKLDYIKGEREQPECTFFHWMQLDHNRKRQKIWESMTNDYEHTISDQHWIVIDPSTGNNVSVSACISAENYGVADKFVVYRIDGCKRGYYCVKVFKRLHQVIEVLEGAPATSADAACTEEYFTEDYLQFDTLLLKDSVEEKCPHHGRYTIKGCDESGASMSFGCTSRHQLVMDTKCHEDSVETYNCHGHWVDREVNYLVLREKHTGKKSCFVYTQQGDMLSMSGFYRHPCKHGILPGVNGHRVYNVTTTDTCLPTSAAHSNSNSNVWSRCSNMLTAALLYVTVWALADL